MKKRMIALITAAALCMSVSGCNQSAESSSEDVSESSAVESSSESVSSSEQSSEPETSDGEEPENYDDYDLDEAEAEPEVLTGFNMIENGDFSEAGSGWRTYTESGGIGEVSMKDKALNVLIMKPGRVEHSVQIYYDGFKLVEGCKYRISFDVSSTVERTVQYRVQLNGGDYHYYSAEKLSVGPDMRHFDIEFIMEETTDPAPRLCFNMGKFEGEELRVHQLVFDNFEFYCIDDSGKVDGAGGPAVPKVLLNQVGYRPDDAKTAVFVGKNADGAFKIIDESGAEVFSGSTSEVYKNPNTKRSERKADFSAFKTPGTYKVVGEKCGESFSFTIANDVYDDAFKDALKMFYLQRCGVSLPASLAGDFAHKVCHNELATINGTSDKIDVSGGWHDAGDYGRYVVSGAKAAADLMLAYEDYPSAFDDALGIPESGNGVPDILDEVRFELDWMLKMQTADGGVYHKVTCRNFPGFVMPEFETDELVVSPVSNTATGDFAATMAMAARIYADIDGAFAEKCLSAAKKSYDYLASRSSGSGFKNPSGIVTGEYPDGNDTDERLWAAAELFKTTGEKKYSDDAAKYLSADMTGLGWADVACYGAYAYSTAKGADAAAVSVAKAILDTNAENAKKSADMDSYQSSIYKEYPWGSNMTIANNGMLFYMTGKDAYGKAQLDYLLGANGTGYCFLTGHGTLSPTSTHHRPSQSIGVTMAGMLAGGPDSNLEDPYAQTVLTGKAPALCYADNSQSYSCNEITVYWNSPLIYLMAAVISK